LSGDQCELDTTDDLGHLVVVRPFRIDERRGEPDRLDDRRLATEERDEVRELLRRERRVQRRADRGGDVRVAGDRI
jgi:hypothetical protein